VQIQHEVNFTVLTIAAPKVEKASEEEEEAEVETAAADSEAEKD